MGAYLWDKRNPKCEKNVIYDWELSPLGRKTTFGIVPRHLQLKKELKIKSPVKPDSESYSQTLQISDTLREIF